MTTALETRVWVRASSCIVCACVCVVAVVLKYLGQRQAAQARFCERRNFERSALSLQTASSRRASYSLSPVLRTLRTSQVPVYTTRTFTCPDNPSSPAGYEAVKPRRPRSSEKRTPLSLLARLLLLELERCPGQDVLQPQDPVEPAPVVSGGGGLGCGEHCPGSRGH